ncbi:MAG: DUF418 domain-containing protein [Planctomycetota bacterium]
MNDTLAAEKATDAGVGEAGRADAAAEAGGVGPTLAGERIVGLDVARGLALLGILLVNIHSMGDAMGTWITPDYRLQATGLDSAAWWFTGVFCEGKFYPLFSLLFGVGMALQLERAAARGGGFAGLYARRMGLLLLIGLAHAWLLWHGDILFYYALTGFVLMAVAGLSARTLTILGAALMGLTLLLVMGSGALGVMAESWGGEVTTSDAAAVAAAYDPSRSSLIQLFEWIGEHSVSGPDDPAWLFFERVAYREGPFLDALGFRVMTWLLIVFFWLLLVSWQIFGLFCLGVAMVKAGWLRGEMTSRWRVMGLWLTTIGLACSAGLVTLGGWLGGAAGEMVAGVGTMVVGPVIAAGYLGLAIGWVARSRAMGWMAAGLAATGRMALTNYLTQSVLAYAVFCWWGLGLFGELSAAQRVGLAVLIFGVQVAWSVAWLQVFAMGPMEWAWRCATYGRVISIERGAGAGGGRGGGGRRWCRACATRGGRRSAWVRRGARARRWGRCRSD